MKKLILWIKRKFSKINTISKNYHTSLNIKERELIKCIKEKKLTYLSHDKLASLVETCNTIENSNLDGAFIEAGCALGGSSILIASLKNSKRPFFVYDVFGMIPAPSENDTHDVHERYKVITEGKSEGLEGDKYYGYEKNLFKLVQENLNNFGIDEKKESVSLIKGLVQDTMDIDQAIAFAHIDVDWYEPVKVCMERIFPNLIVGGSIILDDYHDWGGCRKATDEYLLRIVGQYSLDDSAGSMKITKITS